MGAIDNSETPNTAYENRRDPELASATSSKKSLFWLKIQAIIIFILTVLVITLFALHFSHDHDDDYKESASSASLESSSPLEANKAAAFNFDGQLSVGGGQSFFLKAGSFPEKADALQFAAFPSSSPSKKNLVFYSENGDSYFTTVSQADDIKVVLGSKATKLVGLKVKSVAVLSSEKAVISGTDSNYACQVYVATIKDDDIIEVASESATIEKPGFCSHAFLARVSDTEFVTVYSNYSDKSIDYGQIVATGSISASSDKAQLGKAVAFGPLSTNQSATEWGKPIHMAGLKKTVVPFHVSSSVASNDGLCFGVVKDEAEEGVTCFETFKPQYYIHGTAITDNKFVAAFHDSTKNNAVVVVLMGFSEGNKLVVLDNYVVSDAASDFDFGGSPGYFTYVSVKQMSSSQIVLSFLDGANGGTPTAKVISFMNNQLFSNSPSIPMTTSQVSVRPKEYSFRLLVDTVPVSSSSFIFGFAGHLNGERFYNGLGLAVLKEKAQGLVVSSSEGTKLVASGIVEPDIALKTGKAYYTTTNGEILEGDRMQEGQEFVVIEDVVVTRKSLVGVAISDKQMLLQ